MLLRRLVISGLAVALSASPVLAKDNGKGKGKGNKGKAKGNDVVLFVDRDRELVRTYYVESYGRGCPPGLAKKNNGCLPPGQAKKRYVVGQVLPRTIVYQPAPTVLVQRLAPIPVGYQYVVVD